MRIRYMRRLLLLIASCFPLLCIPRTTATPIVAVVSSKEIVIGSNGTDSSGRVVCKIISNQKVALTRATESARISYAGKIGFDSSAGLWRAIDGNPEISDVEARLVKSLELSAATYVQKKPTLYGFNTLSHEAFLQTLTSHIILVAFVNDVPQAHLLEVTFNGWPRPKAHVLDFPVMDPSPTIGVIWVGNSKTLNSLRPLTTSEAHDAISKRLESIAAHATINRASFQGPFDIVAINAQGVRWISGDQGKCEDARRAAVRK